MSDDVLDSIPRRTDKTVPRTAADDAMMAEVTREWRIRESRTPRSVAEDAFFAGVLHGEKRNGVPIHVAFDKWWPKDAK